MSTEFNLLRDAGLSSYLEVSKNYLGPIIRPHLNPSQLQQKFKVLKRLNSDSNKNIKIKTLRIE